MKRASEPGAEQATAGVPDAAETEGGMETEAARIAALAKLSLGEEEIGRIARDLASILGYVRQLDELDLRGVEPTAHVRAAPSPLRPDEPHESLSQALALREAPRAAEGGFAVPAFVEEDG